MSQENVELVLKQSPGPEVDVVQVFRDDARWAARAEARARFYHPDIEYSRPGLVGGKTFIGIEGLRAGWLDWLTPWATYRIEVEKAIDLGDQVLLLHRSFGRLEGSTQEVEFRGANLWTIRDGRITRLGTYTTHAEAFEAVGLSE
jgi:ketosteroid isomerase-like protein